MPDYKTINNSDLPSNKKALDLLQKIYTKKKEEVEKALQERIRANEHEAQKKLNSIKEHIEKEKQFLEEYKSLISKYGNSEKSLQGLIKVRDALNRGNGKSQHKTQNPTPISKPTQEIKREESGLSKRANAKSLPERNGTKTIVIIDNDQTTIKLLTYFLKKENYTIFTSKNGEEGYRIIRKEKPDLVILDMMLPVKSGAQVITSLKQKKETADIPVIIVSALSQESDIITGFQKGAADYITKPFSPHILLAKIKQILN